MASRPNRRYTSAEMAELILADNDENSDNFSLSSNSSYRDSDEDVEQTVLPPSDSDEPYSNVSSSEIKSDEDGDLSVSFKAAYYATKDPAAKWRKFPSYGAGIPKPGPVNYVPPKDAFDLTYPIEFLHKVLEFGNQRYQHFCQQYLQSSAVNGFMVINFLQLVKYLHL